jgi:hypothetical protein
MEMYRLFEGNYAKKFKDNKGAIVVDENRVFVPISTIGVYPGVMVSREDFEGRGYDTSKTTDEQMKHLAQKIGDSLVENSYWETIDEFSDRLIK